MNNNDLFNLIKRMISTGTGKYEDESISIKQFGPTLFYGFYKCYHVHFKRKSYVTFNKVETYDIVIKASPESEFGILKELFNKGFKVPFPFQIATARESGYTLLIEEYVIGEEIHQEKGNIAWIKTAEELGKIHCAYWGTREQHESGRLSRKLSNKSIPAYEDLYKIARNILDEAPRTIQHADLYPTNILWRPNKQICIIDWTDYAFGPYIMDLGRLTALFDPKTIVDYCPCVQKVIDCYYEKIKGKVTRGQFKKDLCAAQFMEYYFLLEGASDEYDSPYIDELRKRIDILCQQLQNMG